MDLRTRGNLKKSSHGPVLSHQEDKIFLGLRQLKSRGISNVLVASVINCHKCSSLKQHKIILEVLEVRCQDGSPGAEMKVPFLGRTALLLKALGENLFT